MTHESISSGPDPLERAARIMTAGALFAIDPAGIGGICVRSAPGPARDVWVSYVRSLVPREQPWLRIPLNIGDDRLIGGIDLAASLGGGGAVFQSGLLMNAEGGIVQLSMAERTPPALAARLGSALDAGEILCERDGFAVRCPVHFGVIALDEGIDADEFPPSALLDRLGLLIDLTGVRPGDFDVRFGLTCEEVAAARLRLSKVRVPEPMLASLCATALALGLGSIRTTLLALRVSRAIAAADGRDAVDASDAALAAELVFSPRACALPPVAGSDPKEEEGGGEEAPEPAARDVDLAPETLGHSQSDPSGDASSDDWVLAAAVAAVPPGLLARLRSDGVARGGALSRGKSGSRQKSADSGRPLPSVLGSLRGGKRLDVLGTLRAAAPWQRLRPPPSPRGSPGEPERRTRIAIRSEDLRVRRFERRTGTVTIFVVDASGSSALHRLAEAKGAVELLLADCYVRRDRVALIAFRGRTAELLLPPTRSLVRAKRSLAGLPGGGGTPLALGLDTAVRLAVSVRRGGATPLVVLMTDARANVARDGRGDRERARSEATEAARAMRALNLSSLLIDTSPRPQAEAASLARDMGGGYLPLPHADAATVKAAVRAVAAEGLDHRAPGP